MRIIFLIIGAIRRKTVDQKIEGVVHFVGFALLLLLMIVVSYYDVARTLEGRKFNTKVNIRPNNELEVKLWRLL